MKIIETPEQEIQMQIGQLVWQNIAQRYTIETLEQKIIELEKQLNNK